VEVENVGAAEGVHWLTHLSPPALMAGHRRWHHSSTAEGVQGKNLVIAACSMLHVEGLVL
jgi:hypothetical protein